MENHYEVLIVGGGPAAITVAKSISQKYKIGIIRPEDHSMIYCAMPYAIEGILSLEKTLKKDEIVTETGADLIRDRVKNFDFTKKIVHTEQNKTFTYDKIIIATGAEPFIPNIKGVSLKGVMSFKTEEDLAKIINLKNSNLKQAVVIGAGAIGIELSQALHKVGIETHLIDMGEHILPNMIDPDMIPDVEAALIRTGIHLHLNRRVIELGGSNYVKEVILDNGEKIHLGDMDNCSTAADENISSLVVFAVGMKVDTNIFKDTGLKTDRDGIVVNDKMETNLNDVYAIGDCVQFHSAVTGNILSGKLATNTVPMGRVVSDNLLGINKTYSGFYNGAATKVEDYFVGSTGLSEKAAQAQGEILIGYADFTTAFPIMPFAKKVRIKLIADKNTLKILGGQVISFEPVTDKIDQITLAVQFGLTAEDLSLFSYASQPYQSYFPANNLLVAASYEILKKSYS